LIFFLCDFWGCPEEIIADVLGVEVVRGGGGVDMRICADWHGEDDDAKMGAIGAVLSELGALLFYTSFLCDFNFFLCDF
jgi:hypothetical protein